MADHDRVVTDEHLFDEEPHVPLPLQDVEGLGRRPGVRQHTNRVSRWLELIRLCGATP